MLAKRIFTSLVLAGAVTLVDASDDKLAGRSSATSGTESVVMDRSVAEKRKKKRRAPAPRPPPRRTPAPTPPPTPEPTPEVGKRDCSEKSVQDVCVCDHFRLFSFKGYQCSKCKDKFKWGYGCDLECSKDRCPYGCDMSGNCNVPSTCTQNDRAQDPMRGVTNDHGECQSCQGEWHGLWCTKKCPKNCGESSEGVCTRGGKCYVCKSGYYGRQCDQQCPENCPDCVFDDNLIRAPDGESFFPAGTCPEQCEVDNHGLRCDQPCPGNCAKTIPGLFGIKKTKNPSCRKEDGKCFACQDFKFWGETCEKECSKGCEGDKCNKANGLCKGDCKNGFFGDKCDKTCSSGCKGGGCDKENGKCADGCNPGWRGDMCDEACPEGTGPEGCHRVTGKPESCVSGSFPFFEEAPDEWICKSCPENCKNSQCDKKGKCTEGCEVGFYGKRCMRNCGSHCIGACDKTATSQRDGQCTECETGFTGSKCNLRCHPTCKSCKQHSTGFGSWFSGDGATDKDDCTECAADEPTVFEKGQCKCIEDATRSSEDHKCHCNEPTGARATEREAFFEIKPRKQCRVICKEGTREVYGTKESMCLSNEAFRAVIMADEKKIKRGGCAEGENEYVDTTGTKTCLRADFVADVLSYF